MLAAIIIAGGIVAAATVAAYLLRSGESGDEEIVAEVSHELRTPLTSVVGILDVLADDSMPTTEEERRELVELARTEARRMERIVGNLHAASRLARDVLVPDVRVFNFRDLLEEVLSQFPDVARRTFIDCPRDVGVIADRQLLAQVLGNLVQNVDRYAKRGEVEILCEREEDHLLMWFSDDGPGMTLDQRDVVFDGGRSEKGLGMGLPLSRELARAMGGDLTLERSLRRGTTFALTIPIAPEPVPPASTRPEGSEPSLSPRGRLVVDMATVLSERSLDRMVAGLQHLYGELLDAERGVLFVRDRSGRLRGAGAFGLEAGRVVPDDDPFVAEAWRRGEPLVVTDLSSVEGAYWAELLDAEAVMFVPVGDGRPCGILAIGWRDRKGPAAVRAHEVATALARLAGIAVERSRLAAAAAFERSLRASVMEALPIAISIFVGDPPRVVDWNRRERELLGIESDAERPQDLDESQRKFSVRFADGTPLDLENAPVVEAIRTGRSSGPFLLRVRRADGTEVVTRTYCAPFFDDDGQVAGAVVTSEIVAGEVSPEPSAGRISAPPVGSS